MHCCVWLEVGGHEEALLGDGRVEVRSVLTIVANTTLYTWGGHVEALGDGRSQELNETQNEISNPFRRQWRISLSA